MKSNSWESFFEKELRRLIVPGIQILDIGSGLRIDVGKGNVIDPKRGWIASLIKQTVYRVMDPVDTYHPDIVGDIMQMPIQDASYDLVICLSVLEHVSKPWLAADEMKRVLKPGGSIILHVPFLYPYHAMPGYYGDYFRYTEDGIKSLFEDFECGICPIRGRFETLANLLPSRIHRSLRPMARFFDERFKGSGKQVSGYYAILKLKEGVA